MVFTTNVRVAYGMRGVLEVGGIALFREDSRSANRPRLGCREEAGQPLLMRRMDLQQVLFSVPFGKIYHQFQNQHVGAVHDVPGAPIAETHDHFFQNAQMQQHRLLSADRRCGQYFRELPHFLC